MADTWAAIQQVAKAKTTPASGRGRSRSGTPGSQYRVRHGAEVVLPTVQLPSLARQSDTFSESNKAAKYLSLPTAPTEPPKGEGGGGNWKSKLGGVFGDVIDTVDTPRAFLVSAASELGNALPGASGGSQGFSWDDVMDDTWRNKGFGEVLEEEFPDAPWAAKVAGGFTGDVLTDPLTYLTLGTTKALKVGAGGLDKALASGTRLGLSREVVVQAAARDLEGEAVKRLATEAGMRGRGAFTRKGLARSGAADEAADLGLTSQFGYRVRGFNANIPLTRTIAEASENLKGSLKKAFGDNAGARLYRSARVSADMGERQLVHSILTGAENSADAARGLAALKLARMDSRLWHTMEVEAIKHEIPELKSLSKAQLRGITHGLEAGQFDDVSRKVADWYMKVGKVLKDNKVDFSWRDIYVNHTLSKKGLAALRAGDHRLKDLGLNAEQAFQKARSLDGTIAEINAQWRDRLGFDLLEDDVSVLMGNYLNQAENALLLAKTGEHGYELGVVKKLSTQVDANAKAADIYKATNELEADVAKESRWLQDANKARRANLTDAAKVVSERRVDTALELQAVEAELDAGVRRLRDTERALTSSEGRLGALEVAEQHWAAVAKSGRSNAKRNATRQLTKVTAEKDALKETVSALRTEIDTMGGKPGVVKLRQQRDQLTKQHGEIAMQAQELAEARKALDTTPLGTGTAQGEAELRDSVDRIRRVRDQFINGVGEHVDAANAFVWVAVDADTAVSRLNATLARFDEATAAIVDAPKVGRKPLADVEYRREVRDELRSRTSTVQKVLETMPDDPRVKAIAQIEAQTASWDMKALKWRVSQKEIEKQIAVLSDPKFIDHMVQVVDDGFAALGDKLQMPKWLDDAYATSARMKNPSDMAGLQKMLFGFQNWWKSYAVASPGFVARNWYGGVFNIWLDRGVGAAKSMSEFRQFYKRFEGGFTRGRYHKGNPQEALAWAERKFGPEGRAQIEEAMGVAAASGWGLAPQEVTSQIVGGHSTFNPFSSRFAPTGWVRDASSKVEAVLRGSHAYDVIKSGGSSSQALDAVERFHFNYRDVTDFDRAAKLIVPFWTFYSRNMALQSSVWTKMPHKLNRSYYNLKRNLEAQSDPDETVPNYFEQIGAIRTPFGQPNGGRFYFSPDLPSLRFREDLMGAMGAGDQGFDPLRILSDAGPVVKTPLELATNKQFFTGIPFKNRLYDFDSEGNPEIRNAPVWGQIPGIQQGLDMLPGTQQVGGELAMQDNTQYALEGLWPIMGRATRLLPNQPKYEDRWGQSVASFAGAPIRKNTEQSIQGELFRQGKVDQQQRQGAALQQLLQELGG